MDARGQEGCPPQGNPHTLAVLRMYQTVSDGVRQRHQLLGLEKLQYVAAAGLLPLAQPQRCHRPARPPGWSRSPAEAQATARPSDMDFRYGAPRSPPAEQRPLGHRHRAETAAGTQVPPRLTSRAQAPRPAAGNEFTKWLTYSQWGWCLIMFRMSSKLLLLDQIFQWYLQSRSPKDKIAFYQQQRQRFIEQIYVQYKKFFKMKHYC